MMKLRLSVLLLLFFSTAYSQAVLEAEINNLPHGNVYLWNTTTNKVDSIEVKDNRLRYETSVTEPTLFNIVFEGYNSWEYPLRIVLSNHLTSMTLSELKPTKQGSWKSIYPNKPTFHIDPNGNEQLVEFETAWQVFSDSVSKLSPESGDNDVLLAKRKFLYESFIRTAEQLVKNNPDKVTAAVAVFEYLVRNGMIDVNKTSELFRQFDDAVKYSQAGIRIGTHINKEISIEVGREAPHFQFQDLKGNRYDLSSFKNKNVVLHFWSSTCGPCRGENKKIKELEQGNRDIVIINVSLDANEKQWKKAIVSDGLADMINTSDLKGVQNKITQDYYVHGIPSYYLIGKDGKIAGKGSLEDIKNKLGTEQ